MKSVFVFLSAVSLALLALGNSTIGGEGRSTVGDIEASSFKSLINITAAPGPAYKPDCVDMGRRRIRKDSRWNKRAARLAKCECYEKGRVLQCDVTIPFDDIFDASVIGNDTSSCGQSVYNSIPYGPTGKAERECTLQKVSVTILCGNIGSMLLSCSAM